MLGKINRRVSVYRIALLTLALGLTGLGMLPSVKAACSPPGAVRYVIVNPACCGVVPPPKATKQKQVCTGGVWVNSGSPFCGSVSACAI